MPPNCGVRFVAGPAIEQRRVCLQCGEKFPAGANFCPHDGKHLDDIPTAPPVDQSNDAFIGATLDERYLLQSRIGQGGMGVVYAARHVIIDKAVAVKLLRHEYCKDKGLVERFMREARAASRIGHPNIVDVTDFGELDSGDVFFVMEFLDGVSLAHEIRNGPPMPFERVIDLAIQICHGLQAVHNNGIVHRDLKPENVFILNPCNDQLLEEKGGERRDFVKLLDFGIAKFSWAGGTRLTKIGSIFGTPQYMSPEQASGQDADHRGDIYALGCIVYEMLTGEVPFSADTFMGTLTKQMFENPRPPRQLRPERGIPQSIEEIVLKAMAKDAAARYQNMSQMAAALDRCYRVPRAQPPQVTFPPGETRKATRGPVAVARRDRTGSISQPVPAESSMSAAEPRAADPIDEAGVSATDHRGRYPQQSRHLPLVAAISAVAIAGTGAYLLRGRQQASPAVIESVVGPIVDGGADGSASETMVILIETVPSGAAVWLSRDKLGYTPMRLKIRRHDQRMLRFVRRGYRSQRQPVAALSDGTRLLVRLQRRTAGADDRPRKQDLRNPFRGKGRQER